MKRDRLTCSRPGGSDGDCKGNAGPIALLSFQVRPMLLSAHMATGAGAW